MAENHQSRKSFGERNTKKIDGFALGNSPLEYVEKVVNGKSIVLFTTNGSKAIVKSKYSSKLLISSFLNSASIAKELSGIPEVVIMCSGNNGLFSFEDSTCAGDLIAELKSNNDNVELDDASKTCYFLFKKNKKRIKKMLMETEHGKKLLDYNFKKDIVYSAQKNIFDVIPIYDSGSIKLKN